MNVCKIWIEQCEAARGIGDEDQTFQGSCPFGAPAPVRQVHRRSQFSPQTSGNRLVVGIG